MIPLLAKYNSQIEEEKIGGTCGANRIEEKFGFWWEKWK
jgi:hypothetical protein